MKGNLALLIDNSNRIFEDLNIEFVLTDIETINNNDFVYIPGETNAEEVAFSDNDLNRGLGEHQSYTPVCSTSDLSCREM